MAASQLSYTPGSGAEVATDQDAGGAHHQKALIEHLQDGVPTPASEDAPLPVADSHTGSLLSRILQVLLAPLGYDKSLQRSRVTAVVESGTVTTVTTVTTLTTLTTCAALTNITGNIGTYQATQQVWGQNQAAWAALVRARIT